MPALDVRVLRVIRRAPGVRCVTIADRLGEPIVDVRGSLRRLKRNGRVRTKGRTVATEYRTA